MNRSTLARRYAPLAALAAIQLLIIATVPSTAAKRVTAQAAIGSGGYAAGTQSGASGVGGTSGGASALGGAAGAGGTSGSGALGSTSVTAGSGGSGVGQAAGGAAPPGVANGDTSHCVGGREFDPAITYLAPACVPGAAGAAAGVDNGGPTAQGVSGNEITIVNYNGDAGAEVDQILKAEGLYVSYQDSVVLDQAFQNFINKEYVLYGRHVKVISYQGQCTTVPPDTNCLIPEMDKIAAQYHPYAVEWGDNTVCSACYAELARNHVITIGGVGFSDAFANANAPYFYAHSESATRVEQLFAEFYCKQLAHSPVKFAETQNPAQNFNGKPREIGVISTNDPDNESTVKSVLYPALRACGVPDVGKHEYFYAQDINTAAQQVAAGIAAMDTPTNPASIVLCLCDAVAPAFLYEGEKANNYFPENVIATDQGMDLDKAAQSYESGLGCPGGNQCEFDYAFGLAPNGPQQPSTNNDGTRIFALGGGTNLPTDPTVTAVLADDYVMLANLMENTGPDLTPENMQARAPALGAVGGGSTGQALLQFGAGNWSWEQDVRVVYWDRNRKSSYNNQPGTFVTIEGNRFSLGQFPAMSEPPIPATRPA